MTTCDHADKIRALAAELNVEYHEILEGLVWRCYCLDHDKLQADLKGVKDTIMCDRAAVEYKRTENYTGDLYEPGLTVTDIAKRVREDIKEHLPGVRVRVQSGRKHSQLHIKIVKVPGSDLRFADGKPTEHARSVKERIKRLANRYNYDHSDWNSDYSHQKFYLHVEIDHEIVSKVQSVAESDVTWHTTR